MLTYSDLVTPNSRLKLSNLLVDCQYTASDYVYTFLEKIKTACATPLELKHRKNSDRADIVNSLTYFHRAVNDNRSPELLSQKTVFETELASMQYTQCFDLIVKPHQVIKFRIISSKPENRLVSVIAHATHTFATVFPVAHWDGLTINVCLDDTARDLTPNNSGYTKALDEMYLTSTAFNVSGMTQPDLRVVYLTKKEEIVKLLFHELVHYVQLDRELYNRFRVDFSLDAQPTHLNCSEVYAEFMSILFNTCYQSVHLWANDKNRNLKQIFREHLNTEMFYTSYLSGSVLRFYGYTEDTVNSFFRAGKRLLTSPIATWEYIILRGQLLLHLNEVSKIVNNNNWKVTSDTAEDIVDLMRPTKEYIELIRESMKQKSVTNVSYTIVELDWDRISDN